MSLNARERRKLDEPMEKQKTAHKFLTPAQIEIIEKQAVEHEKSARDLNVLVNFNNLWAEVTRHMYELVEINLRLVDEIRKMQEQRETPND